MGNHENYGWHNNSAWLVIRELFHCVKVKIMTGRCFNCCLSMLMKITLLCLDVGAASRHRTLFRAGECWCGRIRRLMIACEGSLLCVEWQTDGCRRPFPSKEGGKNHVAQCLFIFVFSHYQVSVYNYKIYDECKI